MILNEKIALVTGGGSGLGRAISIAYAKYGATVVVADINDAGGQETVSLIEQAGGKASYLHADVTSSQACDEMVQSVVAQYGRLDIACNNAGISPPSTELHEVSDALWDKVVKMDLTSVFYCARSELRVMLPAGKGVIVNLASILGQVAFYGDGPYVAAKHGVVGLTKQLALEYAAKGIRSFSVGPAFMKTGLEKTLDAESQASLPRLHPAGRMGEPEEVGEVVALLSSDGASFINGAYIPIDGGYLSR